MILCEEAKKILEAYRVPVKKRFFPQINQTLFYDEEQGIWTDRFGKIPRINIHIPSIQELLDFCK